MKAILMSIRPEWVAKILNGEKTIEIRKKFPKDYVGWVYIYCTHGRHLLDLRKEDTKDNYRLTNQNKSNNVRWSYPPIINGKVVARFWCDKVEEIVCRPICGEWECYTKTLSYSEIAKASCLENREIVRYLKGKNGYAIHITKLEIFDKPKEISEFGKIILEPRFFNGGEYYEEDKCFLTRAPQSYCFIEV